MKRAVKFMNVEQVDYVAGISHKGPVLVLHDDYMLEHGTFLENVDGHYKDNPHNNIQSFK